MTKNYPCRAVRFAEALGMILTGSQLHDLIMQVWQSQYDSPDHVALNSKQSQLLDLLLGEQMKEAADQNLKDRVAELESELEKAKEANLVLRSRINSVSWAGHTLTEARNTIDRIVNDLKVIKEE